MGRLELPGALDIRMPLPFYYLNDDALNKRDTFETCNYGLEMDAEIRTNLVIGNQEGINVIAV